MGLLPYGYCLSGVLVSFYFHMFYQLIMILFHFSNIMLISTSTSTPSPETFLPLSHTLALLPHTFWPSAQPHICLLYTSIRHSNMHTHVNKFQVEHFFPKWVNPVLYEYMFHDIFMLYDYTLDIYSCLKLVSSEL